MTSAIGVLQKTQSDGQDRQRPLAATRASKADHAGGAPGGKSHFTPFNANGDRTRSIKNRNATGHSVEQDNPGLRGAALAVVDNKMIGGSRVPAVPVEKSSCRSTAGKGDGRLPDAVAGINPSVMTKVLKGRFSNWQTPRTTTPPLLSRSS